MESGGHVAGASPHDEEGHELLWRDEHELISQVSATAAGVGSG